MILFVRLFMFSVTSWLRCHPWAERPQNPGNWNLYRTARQRLTLLWMSAVHRAPSLLSMLGSFRLCNYPDLCFEGILLVWHNKVPLKREGGGTWGSGWKPLWVQRALQISPCSIASKRRGFFDSAYCEINTQVIFLDKLTTLYQDKSLYRYSPRMKLFSKRTFPSRKEAEKVVVAGLSYFA